MCVPNSCASCASKSSAIFEVGMPILKCIRVVTSCYQVAIERQRREIRDDIRVEERVADHRRRNGSLVC